MPIVDRIPIKVTTTNNSISVNALVIFFISIKVYLNELTLNYLSSVIVLTNGLVVTAFVVSSIQ
jgi:hypothetical protein